jgi:hypothetical protein
LLWSFRNSIFYKYRQIYRTSHTIYFMCAIIKRLFNFFGRPWSYYLYYLRYFQNSIIE